MLWPGRFDKSGNEAESLQVFCAIRAVACETRAPTDMNSISSGV